MFRTIVAVVALASSPAFAQVTTEDNSLQEQLVPESFKLTASGVAEHFVWHWQTAVTYTLKNDSGMNLYVALLDGGSSLGSCSEVGGVRGALPELSPDGRKYGSVSVSAPRPVPTFMPAGARVSGTVVLENCGAPNPGSPTAPLSITLLLRRSNSEKLVPYPLSVDAPIRQIAPRM
jgi:hypothetical protein